MAQGTVIDGGAVDELQTSFRGELVRPDDAGYDEHRKVWNGSIDRRPALIARCAGVADVRAAVRFARRRTSLVAVRGGGHSFPGLSVCDDGIVIDLGPMKGIRVDPEARTARVQAGVLLGELDRETQEFGLAVPAGIVTHTGLAGLTLGGGIGWLMRKHGLTIDQLLVRGPGHCRRRVREGERDRERRPLLGSARRRRQLRHRHRVRVPPQPCRPDRAGRAGLLADGGVAGGPALLPRLDRRRPGRADDDRRAPQGAGAAVRPAASCAASWSCASSCCYAGPVEDGEEVVRPLKEFGSPVLDLCGPKPFLAIRAMFDPRSPTAGGTTSAPATSRSSATK